MSGQDIKEHKNTIENAIKVIRNWLSKKSVRTIPSASILISEYNKFKENLPTLCEDTKWIPEELTYEEYLSLVISWIALPEYNPELN